MKLPEHEFTAKDFKLLKRLVNDELGKMTNYSGYDIDLATDYIKQLARLNGLLYLLQVNAEGEEKHEIK